MPHRIYNHGAPLGHDLTAAYGEPGEHHSCNIVHICGPDRFSPVGRGGAGRGEPAKAAQVVGFGGPGNATLPGRCVSRGLEMTNTSLASRSLPARWPVNLGLGGLGLTKETAGSNQHLQSKGECPGRDQAPIPQYAN